MSTSKVILVLGATNGQGRGVVKALAAINSALPASAPDTYNILAVTRSAGSDSARSLLSLRGTTLLEGNVSHPDTLFHDAAQLGLGPVSGVYAVLQSMNNPDGGVVGEERQAKAVADAAARNGVKHFVYSSVDMGGIQETGVSHFESKRRVETYIKTSLPDLPLTILRPTYFMDNLGPAAYKTPFWPVAVSALVYNFSDPAKTIQMVCATDIGKAAAHVFEHPTEYIGREISLAGDDLTVARVQAAYRTVFGSDMPIAPKEAGEGLKAQVEDVGSMFRFFEQTGYKADLAMLQREFPRFQTWEDFLRNELKPAVEAQ